MDLTKRNFYKEIMWMMGIQYRCTSKKCISYLIIFASTIVLSQEFRWITEPRTTYVCVGHTSNLIWEFDEEEKEISKLEWYFNNTLICTKSDTTAIVTPRYQDRIEILGKSGIRLKHVSIDDEGTYTLFPQLPWSTSTSMQSISLQVLEPPTHKCNCTISSMGHPLEFVCEFSSSDCGRPKISAAWKTRTKEVLGEENYIVINSSFLMADIICSPQGRALDCVTNTSHQFCGNVSVTDDVNPATTRRNTLERDTSTMQEIDLSPHNRDTDYITPIYIVVSVLGGVVVINILTATVSNILIWKTMRRLRRLQGNNRNLGDAEMQPLDAN